MPICVYCGEELVCGKCAKEQPVGQTTLACPLKKGAIWIHVTDDAGKDIKGVKVNKGDDEAVTNKAGLAIFESLEAGPYLTSLPKLESPLDDSYDPPKQLSKPVQVADGTLAYVDYLLPRKAKLKVLVLVKPDANKVGGVPVVFKDLPINVTLDALAPKPTVDGALDLGSVSASPHQLSAAFVDVDQKKFDLVPAPDGGAALARNVTLDPEERQEVIFYVLPRPKLKVRFIFKPDPTVENPPEKAFDKLPIRVTVDKLPAKTSVGDRADFETVPSDTYVVKVAFVDPDQNKYDFPEPDENDDKPAEKSIELKPGDDKELVFPVEMLYTKVRFIGHCIAAIPKQLYRGPQDWPTQLLAQIGLDPMVIPTDQHKALAERFMNDPEDPTYPQGPLSIWKAKYYGHPAPADDINARVAFIKANIATAAAQFVAEDDELNVYAMPECFFIGKRGAYEVSDLDLLIGKLQTEVMDLKWRHWLFTFGTVNLVIPPPTSPTGAVASGPIEAQNITPVVRGGCKTAGKASDFTRVIRKGYFSQEMPKATELEVMPNLAKATTLDQWNTAVRAELSSEALGYGFGATENEHAVGRIIQELMAPVEPVIGPETLTQACVRLGTTAAWPALKVSVTQQITNEGLLPTTRAIRKNLIPADAWAKDLKKLLAAYLPVSEHVAGKLMLQLLSDFDGGPKIGGQTIPEVFVANTLTAGNWVDLKEDVKNRVRANGVVPTLRTIRAAVIPGTATTLTACHPLGADITFKMLLDMYTAVQPDLNLLNQVKPSYVFEESFFWCQRRPGPLKDHAEGGVPDNKRVTFGLEICADHGEARMIGATSLQGTKAGIDIQLVISAGMSITPAAVAAKLNGFVFNCDGWNFLNASVEERRIGKYKLEYDDTIPKDPGHNPLYPHTRLVKVTRARVGQTAAGTQEIVLANPPVDLVTNVDDIFAYKAGQLHVYNPQALL
jgi:hypothetical protein